MNNSFIDRDISVSLCVLNSEYFRHFPMWVITEESTIAHFDFYARLKLEILRGRITIPLLGSRFETLESFQMNIKLPIYIHSPYS